MGAILAAESIARGREAQVRAVERTHFGTSLEYDVSRTAEGDGDSETWRARLGTPSPASVGSCRASLCWLRVEGHSGGVGVVDAT